MEIHYSVIIRTIGKAGVKYGKLLRSIETLVPQPEEVIVVLPEGYELPPERLGWESFYFSSKGMVRQRLYGVAQCKTPYALICDDDVEFGADFVEKLFSAIESRHCGFSAGPLFSFLPQKGLRSVASAVTGSAVPTLFHKDRYCSVLRTTGYSYNRNIRTDERIFYEAQSLAWTCFFADIEKLRSIHFEDEMWLDQHGYSAMDDQCMFYKAWLKGIKTYVVSDAFYIHNDAKTSTKGNKPAVVYAGAFNRYVFFRRFIYDLQPSAILRLWSLICYDYHRLLTSFLRLLHRMQGRMDRDGTKLIRKAQRDAKEFLKTATLSPVK